MTPIFKWMCITISCILILNSGCYSFKVTHSIQKEYGTAYTETDMLKPGLLVRVYFEEESGESVAYRAGKLTDVKDTELTVKYGGESHTIPLKQIVKIELLDEKLNVLKTFLFVGICTMILYLVGSLIILHSLDLETL